MAAEEAMNQTGKGTSKKRKMEMMNKREGRLSSLPDEILIKILSCLPLRLAIATECLSWRWRGLWTNVTSIHIDSSNFDCSRDLDTTFTDIITQITSPFIHSFSVELGSVRNMRARVKYPKRNLNYSWLRQICDRNVRQLKSLVSIELDATLLKLQLPDNEDEINLPNLKKLHLCSYSMNDESLEKLIKACPSLQELSFKYTSCFRIFIASSMLQEQRCHIKFSHPNLRRLLIKKLPSNYRVVINAPKLEYLAIHALKSVMFRFEEEPMMSCAAEIDITGYNYLTEDEIKCMTKFYGVFSKVTILSPDVFVLKDSWPSNMFCNATQLTLAMFMPCNIDILLAILELCPVLDVLMLQIRNSNGIERAAKTRGHVSTLQRVLKKIKMEIKCNSDDKTTKSLVELVEYLLSKSVDLKQFYVTVDWSSQRMECTSAAEIQEMKLYQLLYECPVVSAGCEVEFVGRFYKLSRNARLKTWMANGKDIPIIN